ncbi:hypothetical protein [Streptomyces sp. SS8]
MKTISFDDEWAQLVSAAKEKQAARMRINRAGEENQSSQGSELDVTPSVLRSRAGKLESGVIPDLKEAQRKARERVADVPGSMAGFSCDEAVSKFIERWDDQIKHLEGMLGSKGIAGALRAAADDFEMEDNSRRGEFEGMRREYREGDII